jgi:hypothetical protein
MSYYHLFMHAMMLMRTTNYLLIPIIWDNCPLKSTKDILNNDLRYGGVSMEMMV